MAVRFPILPEPSEVPATEMPLSFAQQRMWFLNQYDAQSDAQSNVFYAIVLTGPLAVDALRAAFQEVARRHPALRTRFGQRDGVPYQFVDPFAEVPIPLIEIARGEIRERVDAHAGILFDLENGPLWKAELLRLQPDEHLLLLNLHHIVCDGPSMRILFTDLTALYNAAMSGETVTLPPPPIQYTDYAHWQRQQIEEGRLDTDLAYWRERLRGAPELLTLPTDRPRPATASHAGAIVTYRLPQELLAGLRDLRRRENTSLFKTLLAAFQLLMARYSRQNDVVVGAPVSVRSRPELENVVGFFINTLPLRVQVDPNEPFTELLRRVTETVVEGQEHQEIPFDYLVSQLSPQRSLGHDPIAQVAFALQRPALSALRLTGIEARRLEQDPGATKFDVGLSIYETPESTGGPCEYRTDIFDRATIERMLDHYTRLLEGIVANPQERVGHYELLSDAERRQVLVDWNRNAIPVPAEQTMHGLVEAQAERDPDAVALVFEGTQLTYREFDARANQVAHFLIERGVGPDSRVGLCIDRSLEQLIGLLGIQKAGGAYLPLDPSYPRERLDYIAQDANAQCVISADDVRTAIARYPDHPPAVKVLPRNLAYVIYTSGSTGRPKGVMLAHSGAVNLAHAAQKVFGDLPGSRILQFASLSFDTSVWEIAQAWIRGAALVLGPKDRMLPGAELAALMNEAAVDRATLPPAALAALDPKSLPQLQVLISAGEALSLAQITPWLDGRTVFNGYGPTESTVGAAIGPVSAEEPITLGRPFPNIALYLLDAELQPVPIGVPGELCIGGAGLARGYLDRPDLTAEKFVPNPFGPPGSRMYRSGDLVRYRTDGRVEFLGRTDHQVKIRGFRIELGEIEATLERHPAIAKSLVIATGDGEAKRLAAYYAPKPGEAMPAAAELRTFLKTTLPEHMVPSFLIGLEVFPLTPNDKIDRAALPAPDLASLDSEYAAPRTPIEETLAAIWQQVLHVPRVSIRDHFFEIGGHSLLATQVISRINDAFSIALPVRALFECSDVESLGRRIQEAEPAGQVARLPLVPVDRSGPLPLSFAQQRLWFLSKLEGPSATYNAAAVLRLRGALDEDALVRALRTIVARHEALRTRFREIDGVPVQVIDPAGELAMRREHTTDVSALIDEELHYPFDLGRDALFRVLLIEEEPDSHVLVVSLHHSIADGWSLGVLMKELTALYAGSPLPSLAIQYADFAHWQREWMGAPAASPAGPPAASPAAVQTEYWKTALAGLPPLLDLPTDRPRPPVQTYRGARERFQLPKELREQLAALSQRSGATLFMTLLAAFDVLLGRYSGQTDVAVGTPVANRTRPELEPLIGFFINNLVMRADLSGDPTFTALLQRVRETALHAYAHQDVPFEHLVEQLNPTRSLAYSPLFQVMLVLQNAPFSALRLGDVEVTPIPHTHRATKFDLTMSLMESEEGLGGALEYSTDLFDRATVVRLLDHYRRLLEGIVANPEERISRYELLSEDERRQILVDWNRNRIAVPQEQTMHGLVEAQAARNPDAIALVFEGTQLTYREFDARANQVAHFLIERGVGPDSRVGLCIDRSLEQLIGLLGIQKAGGAYLPLDPSYPKERLDYIAEDANAQCVISADDVRAAIARYPDRPPAVNVLPQNLAYVIYTSGSTGRPKGVMLAHSGAVNLAHAAQQVFGDLPGSRILQFASLSFDTSVWEIVQAWIRGAALVLGPKDRMLPGAELTALMNEATVDRATLPPAALAALDPKSLPKLQVLISAGEALSLAQVTPWLEGRTVFNGYGPTESTVGAAIGRVTADEPITIGRPFANIALYILDRTLQPVPVGVAGELCISGASLARGYLDRPDLTADRFVPNPYGPPGSRMYRTGDVVRYRPDGKIEFVGRTDHQVKIRGFRIELGEIEASIERHPAIAKSLVIATGDGESKRLVAYYAPKPGEAMPAAADLRTFLKTTLPEHMVPALFIGLEAFPLTPNDKIDRAALPAPNFAGVESDYTAPRTPIEETLAAIWQQVLGLPRVGVRDHFFEIGGHSLLATQVISRINDAFSTALPVRALFEAPDIESLGRRIQNAEPTGQVARLPLVPIDRSGPLPLSFAQQRLWFLSELEGPSFTYNMPAVIRLRGRLDEDALVRALEAIVARHEVLRTRFREVDGVPVQVIGRTEDFTVRRQHTADVAAVVDEELHYPFDLRRDVLFRALLIEESPESHVLVLNLHHSIADGWSIGVLMRELEALYTRSSLPPLPIQYADFAHWQREWMTGDALALEMDYWRAALANLPPLLELPTDRPRPPVQTYRGAHERFQLPKELAEKLVALSQRSGATLFMTLLAAFDVLLGRCSGQTDIAVGTPVANRTRPELEPLIGFFINNLVMRADLGGDPTFTALLEKVRETALNAYAHQDIPFEFLVEQLNPARSLSYSPLFQVMLVLQNAPFSALRLPDLEVAPFPHEQRATKVDLTLSLTETEAGLRGALEYSTDLFDRATITRLLDHYRRLLEGIVANPEERISRYTLLSDEERRQILIDWNRNPIAIPQEQTMHGLVEAQAARNPDAIALVFEGAQLTYREFDARANQVAHFLIERGVGPDTRVGLCIDRSLEQLIGLLGIQKAGGAYLPLDPSYPKERLDYIAQDANAQCVISAEDVRAAMARYPDHPPAVKVLPQNLAYVIYTSGSTGRPKGVMLAHSGAVNLAHAAQQVFGDLPGSRILQFASLSFDTSVWEIVQAWIRGAALVLGRKDRMLPGAELTALMNEAAVDRATLPPAALAALDPKSLPQLKVLISAGEALSLAQITPWLEGRTVFNGYGPTESTVGAAIGRITADEPITIGRPFANIALYILDRTLQPVPVGVAGELCISGASLARGYLDRPDLTADRFVPNPYAPPGSRMYRTGDVVRYRPDGKIEFVGRTDHQVKIRGFRIELGEIEASIERHPAIAKSLVIATGEGESKRLVAYYAPKPGEAMPAPADLRAFLKTTLPEHMVPALFIGLEAFPLTPNDKIDRAALPAPDFAGLESDHTAPRTPIEETLAAIWQQVLHVPRVGVRDHFFEIGGHSLLATQVMSRVNDAFSLALPVRALFEATDVESLARLIEGAEPTGQAARLPLAPVSRDRPMPLSFAQQRLWFLGKLEGPSYTYNVPVVLRLEGPLDEQALARALEAIVARHEVLRTRFREADGVPMQVIDQGGSFTLRRERVPNASALNALIDAELHYRFDLGRDELFRALLIDEGLQSHVLILNLHHSIADGWSIGVLMNELAALYTRSPLPPLAIQYADFAHWQREWLTGEVLASETEYWKTALANLPPLLELPTDRPRPPVQSYRGAHEPFRLSSDLTRQLNALSQKSGATLFMTLLAAFDVLLGRYSGQTDLAVGTPVANRTRPELEPLVGFFINTLVLRADLSGDPTFAALLRRVRETALHAYAHQDVPFEYLVEQLNPARSLSHSPLFQVTLLLQNAPFSALRLPGLDVAPIHHEQRATKFDLTLSLTESDRGLTGAMEYSTDLFDRATIVRLLDHYARLLEQIVARPEERISRYELLSDEERRRILVDWNRNRIPVPQEMTMHGLVEAQAARNPHAVALIFEGAQLTYRELNARANQVAHFLIERGVGPDARVGLCIDRSLEQIIGLVGIQKAGGAYVPLDPSYPQERLDYIAADANAQCVISADDVRAAIARHPDHAPAVKILPRNLAYVIYTSGSTGRPKGVMLAHSGAVNLAHAAQHVFGDLPGSRILQFASLSFDTSVWEIVQAWIRGAALVLAPKERMLPGADLVALMNETAVDRATLPPAALAALDPKSLPKLKVLISAGEALSLAQVMPWLEGRTVFNGYGPTESTVGAAIGRITADEPITIGRPFANIALYILDPALQPVPVGVAGELCIGGAGLARGYLDRPDLTAERFVPNPFGPPGSRLYRSGDMVRYRPDGKIEFVGRTDHQVKIRGFRIELGEIEATLERHPAIAKSLVIATGDGESKRLVAYYTSKPGDEAPPAPELRTLLKKTLPEHMVPSFLIALDAFPLTPNDKIDRAALPAPEIGAGDGEHAVPRTPIEHTLARIWEQILRVPRVGIHDHFFEIGGHSLLVVQMITRIRQALGVEIPVIELYQHPTVAALAEHVTRMASETRSGHEAESSASPLVVLSARESGAPLVVIPGIVGVLHGYYDFAQAVGEVRPVYGLHALSIQELDSRHTVESIARLYVSALLDVWDRGPFHLLGHSYGGIIAFEMLRQLEQQGHRPGSLILVDADPLALKMKELSPNVFVLRYLLRFLRLDDVAMPEIAEGLEHADSERLAAVLRELVARRDPDAAYERIDQWVRTIQSRYIDAYAPLPYRPATEVLEIWAQHGAIQRHAAATWQPVLQKPPDRLVMPGDHESVIGREHAATLARAVNEWLEKRAGGGPPPAEEPRRLGERR